MINLLCKGLLRLRAAPGLLPGGRARRFLALVLVLGGVGLIVPGPQRQPPVVEPSPTSLSVAFQPREGATLPAAVPTILAISPPPGRFDQAFLPLISVALHGAPVELEFSQLAPQAERSSPFADYDLTPGSRPLTVRLTPPDQRINAGLPLEVVFIPGEHCLFGDRQACIYRFPSGSGQQVIFTSLHSGVGGEGQALRHALEGTGFNRGLYSPRQAAENARALAGARVALLQGKKERHYFELAAVARIPPEHLQAYFALPVEQTLAFAVRIGALAPDLLEADLFVLETCGWRLPGESWAPGVSATTGSVYLALIRPAP